jgi:uncharacterized coiled-coil protein SlyX
MTQEQTTTASRPTNSDAKTDDVTALRSEVDALRHDVERTDRHLQAAIDRYEAVLTDVTWEYEQRIRDLESRQDACSCAVHRLYRWLAAQPPVP